MYNYMNYICSYYFITNSYITHILRNSSGVEPNTMHSKKIFQWFVKNELYRYHKFTFDIF